MLRNVLIASAALLAPLAGAAVAQPLQDQIAGQWQCAYAAPNTEGESTVLYDGSGRSEHSGVLVLREDGSTLEMEFAAMGTWSAAGGRLVESISDARIVSFLIDGTDVLTPALQDDFGQAMRGDFIYDIEGFDGQSMRLVSSTEVTSCTRG